MVDDTTSKFKRRVCLKRLEKKEGSEYTYTALAATTHPDRVGDILSENAINQIVHYVNDSNTTGGNEGAYRSVSLYHDWVIEKNPALDEVAFIKPGSAKVVDLDKGHKGVEVDIELNKYYNGKFTPEEIKYRIDNGAISGLSIEYDTNEDSCRTVNYNGEDYRYIEEFSDFGGVGLARARMIANPHAVFYKEIVDKVKELENKEDVKMADVKEDKPVVQEEVKKPVEEVKEKEVKEEEIEEEGDATEPEPEPEVKEKQISVKEIVESKEFQDALKGAQPEKKVIKETKEVKQMQGQSLHVKEMLDACKPTLQVKEADHKGGYSQRMTMDTMAFKEAARKIYSTKEYDESLKEAFMGHGVILRPTSFSVKCVGNKLQIVGGMQTKDTLDTTGNTTAFTQSPVEFSDIYVPGIIDTFNNRTDLFDALTKENHIMGTPNYQWRISASQKSSLAVDVDDPTITKSFMDKVKLQTPIKEYRNGVSVTDFMIAHTKAAIGDLFMIEVEKAAMDLRKDINKDLYDEVADGTGDELLGLEAVADSTGNTTLYGLTRSTANRLSADALADTYVDVSGALTTAAVRNGITKVTVDGAERGNLLIACGPYIRDALFELLDGQQQLFVNPDFGFSGAIRFDGVPVLVDSDCPSVASQRQLYVIDRDSDVIVFSVPPQLKGLAKVSAAEEAYVMTNLAHVYKRPRRIHMLDNLT